MPTYSKASPDVSALISDRIASGYYPDLEEAEVTIDILFAYSSTSDPVKFCGQSWDGLAKANGVKGRHSGLKDVTLIIDGEVWKGLSEAEQTALVDRELYRMEVVRDKNGYIKSDDAGRPKLKPRRPDIFLSGFSAIVRRHGKSSPERKAVKTLTDEFGQLLWDWSDDMAPADEAPSNMLSV